MSVLIVCPMCHGDGGYEETISNEIGGPWILCGLCRGTGKVTQSKRMEYVRSFIRREENHEDFLRI